MGGNERGDTAECMIDAIFTRGSILQDKMNDNRPCLESNSSETKLTYTMLICLAIETGHLDEYGVP